MNAQKKFKPASQQQRQQQAVRAVSTVKKEVSMSTPSSPVHALAVSTALAVPVDPPVDLATAVDATGLPLEIGAVVSLINCTVIGLKADVHNRFNVWLMPADNTVVTINKNDILNGAIDGKAILVCGYHCTRTTAAPGDTPADDSLALAQQPAVKPTPDPSVWNLI